MKNITCKTINLLLALVVVFVMQTRPSATTVAIYSKAEKSSLPEMKLAAISAMWQVKVGEPVLQRNGYEFAVAANSVLSGNFSVRPDVTAYFWSDGPVEFGSGFDVLGVATFESLEEKSAAKKAVKPFIQPASFTSLSKVQIYGADIYLDYTLSKPGEVQMTVFGSDGRSLRKWSWAENSSGFHTKGLNLTQIPQNSLLFVDWASGDRHFIRKIVTDK